ncbi:M23 family metallopeptidase [Saccharothrix texasensis]|nr:peptidoglycan DD-metalloendopeptidase family protein [Saccharothrix texasensis]
MTLPAAGLPPSARASRPPRFAWPLAPPHQVVRAFEAPATEYGPGHRGVDLAAPAGAAVLAAADAVVVHAGPVADRAVVSLLHPGGLRTTYEPVTPAVRRGQPVRRGDLIGTLDPGHEGCPTDTCLHWGALRPDPPRSPTYLNPLRLLSTGRARLLPSPAHPTEPVPTRQRRSHLYFSPPRPSAHQPSPPPPEAHHPSRPTDPPDPLDLRAPPARPTPT